MLFAFILMFTENVHHIYFSSFYMEKDFEKYDLQNKGFLTYEEYKALSYSHLKRPKQKENMGKAIFKHDLRELEKQNREKDYTGYFELYSENGYITYGSLRRLCEKVNLDIEDSTILEMIDLCKNKETQRMGYDEFVKLMQLIE